MILNLRTIDGYRVSIMTIDGLLVITLEPP